MENEPITDEYISLYLETLRSNSHSKTDQSAAHFNFYKVFLSYLNNLCKELAFDSYNIPNIYKEHNSEEELQKHVFKILKHVMDKIGIKYFTYFSILEVTKETNTTLKALQHYLHVIKNGKRTLFEKYNLALAEINEHQQIKEQEENCKKEIEMYHQDIGKKLEQEAQEIEELNTAQKTYDKMVSVQKNSKKEVNEARTELNDLLKERTFLDEQLAITNTKYETIQNEIVDEKEICLKLISLKDLKESIELKNSQLAKLEDEIQTKIKLSSHLHLVYSKLDILRSIDFQSYRTLYDLNNKIFEYNEQNDEYFRKQIPQCDNNIKLYEKKTIALEVEFNLKRNKQIKQIDHFTEIFEKLLIKRHKYISKHKVDVVQRILEEQCKQIRQGVYSVNQNLYDCYEEILNLEKCFMKYFI